MGLTGGRFASSSLPFFGRRLRQDLERFKGRFWLLKGRIEFVRQEHSFLPSLLAQGRTQTDCYIGLCCLGYLALIFMSPEKRQRALKQTLFGSVPLWDQIPLSYWDTIHSRWPIFGLLEILGAQVRSSEVSQSDACCDWASSEHEPAFKQTVSKHLSSHTSLPSHTSTRHGCRFKCFMFNSFPK